jgi:hypothetical protein
VTEPSTSRGRRTQRRATERRALNVLRKAALPLQRSFAKKNKIKNEEKR